MAKRVTALVLAFVMCLCVFCSCLGQQEKVIYVEGGDGVTINFVYLMTAMKKSLYNELVTYYAEGDWNSVLYTNEGLTWADMLVEDTVADIEDLLICEYLYDHVYKIETTNEEKVAIEDEYKNFVAIAGSEKALETELSKYSADKDALKRYIDLSFKSMKLQSYLYGTNGISQIPESVLMQTFKNEYSIVTHIYINNVNKKLASGEKISLSEEEAAEKTALAETIYNRIVAGEDFDALKAEFTEDPDEATYYPYGFFVTNDSTFPAKFTSAAMEMTEGEIRLVDSGNGIHIMKKLPMDVSLYSADTTVYRTIFQRHLDESFNALIEQHLSKIKKTESFQTSVDSMNIQSIPQYTLNKQ